MRDRTEIDIHTANLVRIARSTRRSSPKLLANANLSKVDRVSVLLLIIHSYYGSQTQPSF